MDRYEISIRRTSNGVIILPPKPEGYPFAVNEALVFTSCKDFIKWAAEWFADADHDEQEDK